MEKEKVYFGQIVPKGNLENFILKAIEEEQLRF